MKDKISYFRVGVITRTHGIRGAVLVFPTTDDPMRFHDLEEVILRKNKTELILHPDKVSMQKGMVLLHFKEYDNINDIEPYVKGELYISREEALPLEEGEFYISDLIGLRVKCDDGRSLGILSDVIPTGSNNVYEVKPENGKSIYVPAIKDCILSIDVEAGEALVHLLPGMEEL